MLSSAVEIFTENLIFSANIHHFKLSRVKLYEIDLKGNKHYFELAGVSSYRGFELPRINYSKGNQGKWILVRGSTRFELARVRAGVDCSSLSLFNFDGFLC